MGNSNYWISTEHSALARPQISLRHKSRKKQPPPGSGQVADRFRSDHQI